MITPSELEKLTQKELSELGGMLQAARHNKKIKYAALREFSREEQKILTAIAGRDAAKAEVDTLASEVLALRAAPEYLSIPLRDAAPLQFVRIVRKSAGYLLLSDGSLSLQRHRAWESAGVEEYQIRSPLDDSEREGAGDLYTKPFSAGFLEALAQRTPPCTALAAQAIIRVCGMDDTPQEALMTALLQQSSRVLKGWREDMGDAWFAGTVPPPETLGSLLRTALTRAAVGSASSYRPNVLSGLPDVVQDILGWVDCFLPTQDLLTPDLMTERPDLDVLTLPALFRQARADCQAVAGRAGLLRQAVALHLGFTRVELCYDAQDRGADKHGWVKFAPHVAAQGGLIPRNGHPFLSWRDLQAYQPNVFITPSYRIFINGSYRCVVEGKSAALPHDDQVARRMLALASDHRKDIHTLADDLDMLAEIFSDVSPASIDEVRREILAATQQAQAA